MRMRTKIRSDIKFPKFNFQPDVEYIAEKIVVPGIKGSITRQKTIDGGSFPTLSPKTVKKKGHSRPLVDTGLLLRGIVTKPFGGLFKTGVLITINKNRKDIAKYLQISGIRTKSGKKYFNFFGINTRMESLAKAYMRKRIKQEIARA